jgi:hypothetical protein
MLGESASLRLVASALVILAGVALAILGAQRPRARILER